MALSRYSLEPGSQALLDKWLNKRIVKAQMKKGSKLSVTFCNTGIGMHIIAELDKGKTIDYVPLSCDISDYESW